VAHKGADGGYAWVALGRPGGRAAGLSVNLHRWLLVDGERPAV
jgi:hypothetical protein